MTHSRIQDIDGDYSLTFYCGDLPADEAIIAAGHEPNGYFWEGVAALLGGSLIKELQFDSEGGMFCAIGEADALERLQSLLEPVLSGPEAAREVIARAEAEGFELE